MKFVGLLFLSIVPAASAFVPADPPSKLDCPGPVVHYYEPLEKCYWVIRWQSYERAMMICSAQGGRLASVRSIEENDFITQVGASVGVDRVLIGLRPSKLTSLPGRQPKIEWEWTDGSNFSFANWVPSEPSSESPLGKMENCVELHTTDKWASGYRGQWAEVSCDADYYSVMCAAPAVRGNVGARMNQWIIILAFTVIVVLSVKSRLRRDYGSFFPKQPNDGDDEDSEAEIDYEEDVHNECSDDEDFSFKQDEEQRFDGC